MGRGRFTAVTRRHSIEKNVQEFIQLLVLPMSAYSRSGLHLARLVLRGHAPLFLPECPSNLKIASCESPDLSNNSPDTILD